MKRKKFDCVEMKWEIQRRLEARYAGMSEEEARRLQDEKVAANPRLGPFLARVRSRGKDLASR
jgi:hypothetical protein